MQYILLDPITGDSNTVNEQELTQNLQPNVILLRENEHIGIITHRDIVLFCRWCVGQTLSRCQTVPPEAHAAIELVDRWLVNPKSASNKELYQAANAVRTAARATARAAWVADAVRAAAWAAEAAEATGATGAAGAATWAAEAAGAAGVSFEAQARWFVEHLRSAQ